MSEFKPRDSWPESIEDATADRLIVCAAREAIRLDARHDVLYAAVPWDAPKDAPESVAAVRAWANAIGETAIAAQKVALLVEIQRHSRELADAIARRIWEMTEAGDWLIEPLWDYLAERGVDPKPIYEEANEAAKERHA